METFIQPKITGYRQLSPQEVDMMNEGKELAEKVRLYIEKLAADSAVDHRWLNEGRMDLQKGFMSVIRSIAKPTTF